MNEPDDRLEGDPVWELFACGALVRHKRVRGFIAICDGRLALLSWWQPGAMSPVLGVVATCSSVAIEDLSGGGSLALFVPDKTGGTICALFTWAWGAWKIGVAGFVMTFALMPVYAPSLRGAEPPAWAMAPLLLSFGGFVLSAVLSALGLVMAFRSGMRSLDRRGY